MTFTFDSNTNEGRLRTLIDDKDSTSYIFSDEELTNILTVNDDDIWNSAADLSRSLAAKYAKEAFVLGLGKNDIYLDRKAKADYYLKLASTYSSRSGADLVEYWDHYNTETSAYGIDESEYNGDD